MSHTTEPTLERPRVALAGPAGLPPPVASRKGRALRGPMFTRKQRKRLAIALAAVTIVALCVVFL